MGGLVGKMGEWFGSASSAVRRVVAALLMLGFVLFTANVIAEHFASSAQPYELIGNLVQIIIFGLTTWAIVAQLLAHPEEPQDIEDEAGDDAEQGRDEDDDAGSEASS